MALPSGDTSIEVFAEGGGNAFVEFDAQAGSTPGITAATPGGFTTCRAATCGRVSASTPLSNPYAFGYFNATPIPARRASRTTSLLRGGSLPGRYLGRILGVEPIQGRVVMADRTAIGSSFKTQDTGHPIKTSDRWFRPVDIKAGPDGAVYVCDWYDSQVNHYRNHEGKIDPQNGRVYRLRAKGAVKVKSFDLAKRTTSELIALLQHKDKWHRQTALRLLGDRKDVSALPKLKKMLAESLGQAALEALWAVNLSGGFTPDFASGALDHADPYVRLWTVRMLGDERVLTEPCRADPLARCLPRCAVNSQQRPSACQRLKLFQSSAP